MNPRVLLLFSLLLISGRSLAQNTAVMRFSESTVLKLSFIYVTYDDGRSENIELENLNAMNTASAAEARKHNQQVLQATMKKIEEDGYILSHMSGSISDVWFIFKR